MNNNDRLFINENTGLSVFPAVSSAASALAVEVIADCDLCSGDIVREVRGSLAGSVVRILHQCSEGGGVCDVSILPYQHEIIFPYCEGALKCDSVPSGCSCMRAYLGRSL